MNEISISSLGIAVREERMKRGLTITQLGENAGLHRITIHRLEVGQISELRSEPLKRLALALGVTTDYLVGRPTRSLDAVRSYDEEEILRLYHALTDAQKATFVSLMTDLTK